MKEFLTYTTTFLKKILSFINSFFKNRGNMCINIQNFGNNIKNKNGNVFIGKSDELSHESIWKNCNKVTSLENEFDDRLLYTSSVMSETLLPKELQSDFKITPTFNGNKLKFESKPITPDAYEKFPPSTKITMKFDNKEDAQDFRKNGFNKLIEKAEKSQQPVEIPNIIDIKDFLGNYEDPMSHNNANGHINEKIYILPKQLPPPEAFEIKFFNPEFHFSLQTNLGFERSDKSKIVLVNKDAKLEPFDVRIVLSNIKQDEESLTCKIKVNISLKEQFACNCKYSKELLKYEFLLNDTKTSFRLINGETGEKIINVSGCGKNSYNKEDYKKIKNTLKLIDKVIYISEILELKIKYDLKYFIQNAEPINLLYSSICGKKYIIQELTFFGFTLPKNKEFKNFCSQTEPFSITTNLEYIDLFGTKISLEANKLNISNCSIIDVVSTKQNYKVKISTANGTFVPKNENK